MANNDDFSMIFLDRCNRLSLVCGKMLSTMVKVTVFCALLHSLAIQITLDSLELDYL